MKVLDIPDLIAETLVKISPRSKDWPFLNYAIVMIACIELTIVDWST